MLMSYKDKRQNKVFNSKEGYNLYASNYKDDYDYLNSFEKDELLKLIGDIKGKQVLDAGCGTGRMISELREKGAIIKAVDISEEALRMVNNKFPDVETILADVNKLPFKDESFDFVLAAFLIVHIKNINPVFDEIHRVLKNNGRFILSNINQRKSPKLKLTDGEKIVIKSFYHMPKHVIAALENSLFTIKNEEFVYENGVWTNQIIEAIK